MTESSLEYNLRGGNRMYRLNCCATKQKYQDLPPLKMQKLVHRGIRKEFDLQFERKPAVK